MSTSFLKGRFESVFRKLPTTATAPFCPSEIEGSIEVEPTMSMVKKIFVFAGPGLLVSVGYMDPGNWATDIEAGSKYRYSFLSIILFSSLAAMLLQWLSMRLGLVTQKDLAVHCRENYPRRTNIVLWIFAEVAIIATDIAEVLGSSLAIKLLFGIPLKIGVFLTAFDTLIVLALKGKGFRRLEAIILALVLTIGVCFAVEIWWLKPAWDQVALGFVPTIATLSNFEKLYLAIGILGATVMPHNLYLHSAIIKTRKLGMSSASISSALKFATLDTVVSLLFAFLINAGILILAAAAFNLTGHTGVTSIDHAYELLEPIAGGRGASILFGVALLASGQSSTFTGTIAGQILLEGFLKLKIPCWKRRVITRGLALIPAFIGVSLLGDGGIGTLLVITQVILSLQLPFAIFPLIRFNQSLRLMSTFAISHATAALAWALFAVIAAANLFLVSGFLMH